MEVWVCGKMRQSWCGMVQSVLLSFHYYQCLWVTFMLCTFVFIGTTDRSHHSQKFVLQLKNLPVGGHYFNIH